MKRVLFLLVLFVVISCGRNSTGDSTQIISVSIAPYKYFVEAIAGTDFKVNVMVAPGANPHVYEPYPEQIADLRRSVAYISNGFLGFEMAWLERFYEINSGMKRLSLGDKINPLVSEHAGHHEEGHQEGADPHYWISPKCAAVMASSVFEFLCGIDPAAKVKYEKNYNALMEQIVEADRKAEMLFSEFRGRSFMIYHPNLAYLARDYGLYEVAVEFEGKEPTPSRLKELIDMAEKERINTIFVQKEYDIRNAKAIANEIGAEVTVIDPLSGDWLNTLTGIIDALHKSFNDVQK